MQGRIQDPSTLAWNAKRTVDRDASLWNAVAHVDSASVRELLALGANPNGREALGLKRHGAKSSEPLRDIHPLLLAASLARAQIMRDLLAAGSDRATLAVDGSSLLMRAAQSGSMECFELACSLAPDSGPN